MEVNEIFDRLSRHLEARQFSKKYLFIFQDERNGKVNLKPSCAYQAQQPKCAASSRSQPSDEDIRVNDKVRCRHTDIVNRAVGEGNVLSRCG
jgi:23S rRNA-/tRNA-specific pseudouridylate synthase